MKKIKYKRVILFFVLLIIGVGAFLRINKLSSIPPQPSLDEVSIGYNAYSILKTGKDEFGTSFPVLLRAYDDYRPALYVYFVIPFVWLLDLNVLAVRLPSVILSIISIGSLYVIARRIYHYFSFAKPAALALVPTTLLAISPWHIYISRLGHEVNAFVSFFFIGFAFFLNSIKEKKVNALGLSISAAFFALSFSAYQSGKVFIPLFVLMLAVFFYKTIKTNFKKFIPAILVGILFSLPIIIASLQPEALLRLKATSIFNIPFETSYENAKKLIQFKEDSNYLQIVLHNRHVYPYLVFGSSFISHFTYDFLYGSAYNEQFKIPGFGLYHVVEIPLLAMGLIYMLIKKKIKWMVFLGLWYVVGILPSAISTQGPHAMRAFSAIGSLLLISGLGIGLLRFKKKKFKNALVGVSIAYSLLLVVSISKFYTSYSERFPVEYSSQFQYGVLNALEKIKEYKDDIYVSNRGYLTASYMYYLFATKYDPIAYQNSGGTVSGWFNHERMIGKVNFINPLERLEKGIYIINPSEYTEGEELINVKNLKNEVVIQIVRK